MRARDLVIAGGIVGLAAWAVVAQVGTDPVGAAITAREPKRLDLGDPLEDQEVVAVSEVRMALRTLLGKKATVFVSWSSTCPCMATKGMVDDRLLPVIQRWKSEGVSFLAVAGDPRDTAQTAAQGLLSAWAHKGAGGLPPYFLLLDPTQRLCRQLGFREAAHFAVLDANGALRYRGTFDDDLKRPTRTFLPEALEAVVAGRAPEHPISPPVEKYGCPFGAPIAECPIEEPK